MSPDLFPLLLVISIYGAVLLGSGIGFTIGVWLADAEGRLKAVLAGRKDGTPRS